MQDKIPVEKGTIPVRVSDRKARKERLLEFEALADFVNLGDTLEDWERFRQKWPRFFPDYLTQWLYDSAKHWKVFLNSPDSRPDSFSEIREERPPLLFFRSLLRVVWKRKDRDGRCLKTLLGFKADMPYEELWEEEKEEVINLFEFPGRPRTEEEIEEEEAQKVLDDWKQRAREGGGGPAARMIASMRMVGEVRVALGGLPVGSSVVSGETGIITWEFGCHFQRAVYDLMQDRWRAMVCPECGTYFVAGKTAQKFCSPKCWAKRKREQALDYYNRKGKHARQKAKSLRAKPQRRINAVEQGDAGAPVL